MGISHKLLHSILLPPLRKFRWAGFFLILLFTASCNTVDPPPDKTVLTLTLEDVSCTEAWITLTTNNLQLPAALNLIKDNTITKTINLQTADTLLYIDSLLPNQTYNFKLSGIGNPASGINSNELSVSTMDTTSHNFTFETWTFGGTAGSSTLYDVAIVNDSCIWAVGEIYVADTSAIGYTMYNAVYWDGSEWTLKRITVEFRGFQITPPLEGAFAFSNTDIWVVGSLPIHGDGENWVMYDLRTTVDPNLSLSEAWGANSDYMYFVGSNGSIAHKQNNNWSKIESGATTRIADIWGIIEGGSGYNKYLAVEDIMLRLDDNNQLAMINAEAGRNIISIWGVSNRLIYTAGGDGVVLYKNSMWERISSPDVNNIYRIKGENHNNVFGLTALRTVLHFNGYSWSDIYESTNNSLLRLDVKFNLVVSAGWQGGKAVIILGRRNVN